MFDLDALSTVDDGLRRLAGPVPDDVRDRQAAPAEIAARDLGPLARPSSGGCPHLLALAEASS